MTKLSPKAESILTEMRNGYESNMTDKDGAEWGSVYLDNFRPKGMSVTSFRSYLRALSDAGFYRVYDGYAFGYVRLDNPMVEDGSDKPVRALRSLKGSFDPDYEGEGN